MKTRTRKLQLGKETIRTLGEQQLRAAAGGDSYPALCTLGCNTQSLRMLACTGGGNITGSCPKASFCYPCYPDPNL